MYLVPKPKDQITFVAIRFDSKEPAQMFEFKSRESAEEFIEDLEAKYGCDAFEYLISLGDIKDSSVGEDEILFI